MSRLNEREKERDISLASLLDSMYGLAEEYLLQDKGMKEKYETKFMDLLCPEEEKELFLNFEMQWEISNIVYGRERAISSIAFLLGMQFGAKFMQDEANLIELAIKNNIIV